MGATLLCGRSVFLRRLDLEDRPAGVIAAVRAGAVAALRLMAVRAFLELREVEREVRAAIPLSSVGDASLGHAHGGSRSFVRLGRIPAPQRGRIERAVYSLSPSPSTRKPRS